MIYDVYYDIDDLKIVVVDHFNKTYYRKQYDGERSIAGTIFQNNGGRVLPDNLTEMVNYLVYLGSHSSKPILEEEYPEYCI